MIKRTERDILRIIQNALELKDREFTIDSSESNVAQWDSLGQINIIVALDETFEGAVSRIPEMATADSARKIVQILQSKGLIEATGKSE